MRIRPGTSYPLGATWEHGGANFALYSENATAVELCLFDEADRETRIAMPNTTAFVWHVFVPGAMPGQRYGFRVDGPYAPERGLRFNPEVVLLDPYARALDGIERWDAGCFAYPLGSPRGDLERETRPVLGAPRGVVLDTAFDWEGDEPLRRPLHRTVIYEAHVRGSTMRHPDVPEALRGTYSGLAHPAVLRYLTDLGVTAIELLPVHAFVDDHCLKKKGLRNYWGYNSICFFAPDVRYRSSSALGSEVAEFKSMVKAMHRAGIEVILDVVYNHTAEGNHLGPTMSLKGIDNPTYYRLAPDEPRYYSDYTGTGNTLNVRHPQVLALIMDSLRYWATDMHVDGFRFDLASSLARQLHEVDRLSSFFALIHQSPDLSQAKIIAEPWDLGEGGYQVGNFPVRWAEWNGRYRDAVRALWRGDGGRAGEIGYRLTGSSDLYELTGRRPSASINLITAHDGYTLRDLVTYEKKRNELNLDDNRDGADGECSFNCGIEGPTADPEVSALRARQQRNLMATLLLSQGTPMLVAGDEFGRTQQGNNNAYCQDNELSWLDWSWMSEGAEEDPLMAERRTLHDFTRTLLRLRREHPGLHRAKFFQGRPIRGSDVRDLNWFRSDGQPMSERDWNDPVTRSLQMFLAGRGIDDVNEDGRPIVDDDLLLLLNASDEDLQFVLPSIEGVTHPWHRLLDTSLDSRPPAPRPGDVVRVRAKSLQFFSCRSQVVRTGGSHHTLGATYRVQLSPSFTFRDAESTLDYLVKLGITDLYLSPILAAAPGSTHGYDVVDHRRLNAALGTRTDLRSLAMACKARQMGILLDWVPNHMGIASDQNRWFSDVLENGPSSVYADHFDIDWVPPKEVLRDRVLLPILGTSYGEALERGELELVLEEGRVRLAYYDWRLPLGPKTTIPILHKVLSHLADKDSDVHLEIESIVSSLRYMPEGHETTPDLRIARAREKQVASRRLQQLIAGQPEVRAAVLEALADYNGRADVGANLDALDELLQCQAYRLASWRVAAEEINYRRFFDVNELGAIRMESPAVFADAHALLFELVRDGDIQALRLDHTAGLYDPGAYFDAMQSSFSATMGPGSGATGPDDLARPWPLLIEHILEPGERLPPTWAVDGTTGYEFCAASLGLFVAPASEREMSALYARFTGDQKTFMQHAYECKLATLRDSLASEVNMLARALERIAGKNRRWRDFTLISLTRALVETVAAFQVYRTYVREDGSRSAEDEVEVRRAIARARRRDPATSPTVFSFLEEILLLQAEGSEDARKEHARFTLRFQQLTGPVMAKALEDTAFYRYGRLLCLNEVGSMPSHWGITVEQFHAQNVERSRDWPLSMLTTATHDTKRGDDAAARIAVLSEMPELWGHAVTAWTEIARTERVPVDGLEAPSRTDEYAFFQAAVGAWPYGWDGRTDRADFVARLSAFLLKAAKEAKTRTSWAQARPEYDAAISAFPGKMFAREAFVGDLRRFVEVIAPYGATNGVARTLLKLCSPGVPDTYWGSEGWNQSLVDPDNRRRPDFAGMSARLDRIVARCDDRLALTGDLLAHYEDGGVKAYVTHVALDARRRFRELFLRGDYRPVDGGPHVVAFERTYDGQRLVCVAPRLSFTLTNGGSRWPIGAAWRYQRLCLPGPGKYRELMTGRPFTFERDVAMSELLSHFPVALLHLERS